jgi:hypothetical protein
MVLAFGMLVFGCSGGKTVKEVEPNDSVDEAQLINVGAKVTGEFQSDGDVDIYKIVLSKPGTLTVSTESKLPGYDLWIGSLDEDGNPIDEIVEDRYEGDMKVETHLSAGTYVIGVVSLKGPYTLITSFKSSDSTASSKSSGAKALIGTWKEVDFDLTQTMWTFTKDQLTQEIMGMRVTYPYKIKGNYICFNYQGADIEVKYELQGDTLKVDYMILDYEFKRVK